VSSAILYVAIVAIWAVVLVPRWLHTRSAQPEPAEQPAQPEPAEQPAQPEPAEQPAQPQAAEPVPQAAEPLAQAADAGPAPGDGPGLAEEPDEPDPAYPFPDDRRADIFQARRRMLIALAVLTAGAAGLAVTGITAPWVIAPPAVLLAGFVVLLREAARANAEHARRATRIGYAEVSPLAGQEPGSFREDAAASPHQVPATVSGPGTAEAQPDADVIDISARISDQVYDQYSDAAERAVGD
jgi:hypothetical protein